MRLHIFLCMCVAKRIFYPRCGLGTNQGKFSYFASADTDFDLNGFFDDKSISCTLRQITWAAATVPSISLSRSPSLSFALQQRHRQ